MKIIKLIFSKKIKYSEIVLPLYSDIPTLEYILNKWLHCAPQMRYTILRVSPQVLWVYKQFKYFNGKLQLNTTNNSREHHMLNG